MTYDDIAPHLQRFLDAAIARVNTDPQHRLPLSAPALRLALQWLQERVSIYNPDGDNQ